MRKKPLILNTTLILSGLLISSYLLSFQIEHNDPNSGLFLFILSIPFVLGFTLTNFLALRYLTHLFHVPKYAFISYLTVPLLSTILLAIFGNMTQDKIIWGMIIVLAIINCATYFYSRLE